MPSFVRIFAASVVTLSFGFVAGPVHSAIVVTQLNGVGGGESTIGNELAYLASASDLINQGSPTFSPPQVVSGYTPFTLGGGSGTTTTDAMNNGVIGASNDLSSIAFDLDGVWSSTFNLNTTLNPAGYDVTRIQTISGWSDNRTNQQYQVLYSRVGDGGVFTSLGNFFYRPNSGTDNSTRLTLDIAGLTQVAAIEFVFAVPDGGTASVYREADVFGSASVRASAVPEPASLGAFAAGTLLVLRRRYAA